MEQPSSTPHPQNLRYLNWFAERKDSAHHSAACPLP